MLLKYHLLLRTALGNQLLFVLVSPYGERRRLTKSNTRVSLFDLELIFSLDLLGMYAKPPSSEGLEMMPQVLQCPSPSASFLTLYLCIPDLD